MPETAAERNARLQAQFEAAQAAKTEVEEPAPYYAPTSYMAPNVPAVTTPVAPQTTIFGEPIDLEGPIGLSFADQPLGQTVAPSDFYSQGGMPQAGTQQTDWGQFYAQGPQAPPTPTSWTEQELEMLGGMDVQAAINWGANYTGQALFGGWNVVTNEPFTGAFDMTTGELVNPEMMPSLLGPEFAYALGISEEQRVMMGYNPEYPYELQDIPSGGGGVGGGGGGGGGYSPSKGYGYSPTGGRWGLTMWRIS